LRTEREQEYEIDARCNDVVRQMTVAHEAELKELWECLVKARAGLVAAIEREARTPHMIGGHGCQKCAGLRAIMALEERDGLFSDRLAQ